MILALLCGTALTVLFAWNRSKEKKRDKLELRTLKAMYNDGYEDGFNDGVNYTK